MTKIIECVPNFSEGRNKETIEKISESIRNTLGCTLLDVDPGDSTNRTVFTFVGSQDTVVEGALNAAKTAFGLIDMRKHKGEHPRMGALDVCPFIPVKGATMDDCVKCANEFGKRLAAELQVPVYLYSYAAKSEKRQLMPTIRSGEYEGLQTKLGDPEWKPDYGPVTFVPSWGATVTGARDYLLAYNVNLVSTKEQAHKIALNIRETGRGKDKPGRLKCVQGIGWYLKEQNMAQVSVNITNYKTTALHVVYEEVKSDAREYNLPVVGSEAVGLLPLETLLKAAEYYMEKEKLFMLEERSKVRLAINRLGLNSLSNFDPDKKVIEYMIKDDNRDFPLASQTLKEFITSVGARSPAPGGGSVSATVAAFGSALGSMAGLLTYGKRQWETLETTMRSTIPELYNATQELIPLIDADSKAFDQYMVALKLPKSTPDESAARGRAMEEGILQAIKIPLSVMSAANNAWRSLQIIAKHGNIQCVSDVQVGAKCLETGVWGAHQNVLINLPNVRQELRANIEEDAKKAVDFAHAQCKEILEIVEQRIASNST